MMRSDVRPVLLLVAAIFALGCPATRNSPSGKCTPGITQECLCAIHVPGIQSCKEDGTGFNTCSCSGEPTTDGAADSDAMPGTDGGTTGPSDVIEDDDVAATTSGDTTNTGGEEDSGTTGGSTTDGGTTGGGMDCESDSDCPELAPTCTPQGTCVFCYPGTHECQDNKSMLCAADGTGWLVDQDCTLAGAQCNEVGVCQGACGGFGKLKGTNVGCEFWAVDMRNAQVSVPAVFLDAQNAPFVVVVSNTAEASAAEVTVQTPDGGSTQATIPAGQLATFPIAPTFGLEGTGKTMSGVRIISSQPVAVFQFNPYSNVDVFSNDASTLLPADGQGGEYRVVTLPHSNLGGGAVFPGYVVVVGAGEGSSKVIVTTTAATIAGGGVPALSPGQPYETTLNPGEVLSLESSSGDLSGTRVQVDGLAMVYAGHVAARPTTTCCSDHLEQQMPPTSAWGTEYVVARFWERGKEPDYIKVVAREEGTSVTITANGVPSVQSLGAGQHLMVETQGHAEVKSNKPVLVAHIMAAAQEAVTEGPCNTPADCGGDAYKCEPFSNGSAVDVCLMKDCAADSECGPGFACAASLYGEPGKTCKAIGDPAMSLAVPVSRWQDRFVFIAPDKYKVDYVNIVTKPGTKVTLDGEAITDWESLGAYSVHRRLISDGPHVLDADGPTTATVYGFDNHVSYAYPAGVRLK